MGGNCDIDFLQRVHLQLMKLEIKRNRWSTCNRFTMRLQDCRQSKIKPQTQPLTSCTLECLHGLGRYFTHQRQSSAQTPVQSCHLGCTFHLYFTVFNVVNRKHALLIRIIFFLEFLSCIIVVLLLTRFYCLFTHQLLFQNIHSMKKYHLVSNILKQMQTFVTLKCIIFKIMLKHQY